VNGRFPLWVPVEASGIAFVEDVADMVDHEMAVCATLRLEHHAHRVTLTEHVSVVPAPNRGGGQTALVVAREGRVEILVVVAQPQLRLVEVFCRAIRGKTGQDIRIDPRRFVELAIEDRRLGEAADDAFRNLEIDKGLLPRPVVAKPFRGQAAFLDGLQLRIGFLDQGPEALRVVLYAVHCGPGSAIGLNQRIDAGAICLVDGLFKGTVHLERLRVP